MAKEKITGAEAMMRSLEYQGVKTLFGYPGGYISVLSGQTVRCVKNQN